MTDDGGRSLAVVEEDVQSQEHPRYAGAETVEKFPETIVATPEHGDLDVRLVAVPDAPQPLEVLPPLVALVELLAARHDRYPRRVWTTYAELGVWLQSPSAVGLILVAPRPGRYTPSQHLSSRRVFS